MTTMSAPRCYSPTEVVQLSDESGKLYELSNGELIEKGTDTSRDGSANMRTRANCVASKIVAVLRSAYPLSKAYIFVEQPTYCFSDLEKMRRPDVCMVWANRLPDGLGDDELEMAPDLVVEIVSPTNTYVGLLERVDEYLSAGVPIVWLVDPNGRSIHVYMADGTGGFHGPGGVLTNEPRLPGLVVRVADLFPPAPASSKP